MNNDFMFARTEVIGSATLYLGDCLEMTEMFKGVDVVITDPPGEESWPEQDFERYMDMCLRIAKGWVVTTCDFSQYQQYMDHEKYIRLGIWKRTSPNCTKIDYPLQQDHQYVLLMHTGKMSKKWDRRDGSAIWNAPINGKDESSLRKPIALLEAFVSDFTTRHQVIFDGCMGHGTTGVAAVKRGRRFIGCEIMEDKFEIACERIEEAQDNTEFTLHDIDTETEETSHFKVDRPSRWNGRK